VPLTVLLAGGQQLDVSLLVHREPVNFRVHHGQGHIITTEELASWERPPNTRNMRQTIAWIKGIFYKKECNLLRYRNMFPNL
jgi:hypothetical protein